MPHEKFDIEKEMMRLASLGDEESFVKLFCLYRHKLYSYTLRITESPELAEDLVQDVFLKLWKNRSQLAKVEHFSAFIFKMVQNQAVNAFRRVANETLILSKLQSEVNEYKAGPQENTEYKEIQLLINSVVKKLPPQQNLVFKLSREQGLKNHEIAQLLKISPYTVKNHLVLALQAIRINLRRNLKIEYLPLFINVLHWFKK